MIRLSIIVPIYNVEQYLERCVSSLINQDIKPSEYEIILVNDGSTDTSYEKANSICTNQKNVLLISQENKGLSEARNFGLDIAQGRYIMFVDSDDQLFPNILSKTLDIAESNNLDVLETRMKVQKSDGQEYVDFIQPFSTKSIFSGKYSLLNGVHIGSVCTNMYSREFLNINNLRFTPGIYHEDVEFNLRMYAFAKRIIFTDVVSYFYRYNVSSINREGTPEKIVRSYQSEFQIAKNIKEFSNTQRIGPELKSFYQRHQNSALVSCLISLLKRSDLDRKTKSTLFEELKNSGLYPLHGRTLSWKTTCIIPFFNIECIYKKILLIK